MYFICTGKYFQKFDKYVVCFVHSFTIYIDKTKLAHGVPYIQCTCTCSMSKFGTVLYWHCKQINKKQVLTIRDYRKRQLSIVCF